MSLPLRIDKKRIEPDITVLELAGRLALGPDTRRVETMVEALLRENERKFIVDLSGVDYIDSTGMGSITFCFTRVSQTGGGLRVAGPTDRVRQLFKMTRLDTVLPIYPTVQAASEGFTIPSKPGS